jgi:hypothetical protein
MNEQLPREWLGFSCGTIQSIIILGMVFGAKAWVAHSKWLMNVMKRVDGIGFVIWLGILVIAFGTNAWIGMKILRVVAGAEAGMRDVGEFWRWGLAFGGILYAIGFGVYRRHRLRKRLR